MKEDDFSARCRLSLRIAALTQLTHATGRYDSHNHISSALMPRRESLLEERKRASSKTHDTAMIVKHASTADLDFDLDDGEAKGQHMAHLDHDADPGLDGDSDEDGSGDGEEMEMVDKVCKVIFRKMKAMNLTEMDPQYAGGGSDPYINFVPLTEHLYTHRHMKHVGKATGKAFFHRLPRTRTIKVSVWLAKRDELPIKETRAAVANPNPLSSQHELNPVWDDDVVEIDINVKSKVRTNLVAERKNIM